MKCLKCEVCGKTIDRVENGAKLCIPVIVGTGSGSSAHCWCVCDDCKDEFLRRSARVLQETDIKSLPQ